MELKLVGTEDLVVLMALCTKAIDKNAELFLDMKTSINGNQHLVISAQQSAKDPLEQFIIPKEGEIFDKLLMDGLTILSDYVNMENKEESKYHNLVKAFENLTGITVAE